MKCEKCGVETVRRRKVWIPTGFLSYAWIMLGIAAIQYKLCKKCWREL